MSLRAPIPQQFYAEPNIISHECSDATGKQGVSELKVQRIRDCGQLDGFRHLLFHCATSAYDSDEQLDVPKCHPHTRTAILDEIMAWIQIGGDKWKQYILWLTGPAGSGKTAIGRSIVALCLEQHFQIARFFFFRTDRSRNTIIHLVSTLATQLVTAIPELRPIIVPTIQNDSLIFTKSLETQLRVLLLSPLKQLEEEFTTFPNGIVFLIDGLDECMGEDDQVRTVLLFRDLIREYQLPIIVLFSSRPEPHLQMAFNSCQVDEILCRLVLDQKYLPDKDIRLFLNDSFNKLRTVHPLKSHLEPAWPCQSDIEELVTKSSGQFIYASVVTKFISLPKMYPPTQLEIVLGLRPAGRLTPFAQLDELYRYILAQVDDIEGILRMLSVVLLGETLLDIVAQCVGVEIQEAYRIFGIVASVIAVKLDYIEFLHASLVDFLLDQQRSKEFCIGTIRWHTSLATYLIKILSFVNKPKFVLLALGSLLSKRVLECAELNAEANKVPWTRLLFKTDTETMYIFLRNYYKDCGPGSENWKHIIFSFLAVQAENSEAEMKKKQVVLLLQSDEYVFCAKNIGTSVAASNLRRILYREEGLENKTTGHLSIETLRGIFYTLIKSVL